MSFPFVLAIPSPDLVLNLFASAGQLLGLVAVTAGGVVVRGRARDAARRGSGSPWPLRVALLALCATGASFLLYHLRVQDLEQARLRANLTRPSMESGREVGDASLKTLSFSEQLAHPAQLSTEELEARINRGERLNLIDVRETEEAEMGRIRGTWHRRYPDLFANRDGLQQDGVETILICYSGNRSSELVDAFAADGIPCKFIVGGYEKWIAEGRALDLAAAAEREELRAIPRYENDDVLLDTEDVLEAVQKKGAIFVDVRYPEEFKAAHLPNAVNITMRRLTSAELDAALAALPEGPVILPCYDKRSSFFASLAGLRLTRMGREVLGRYTLPHEYFVPKGERDYAAAWNAARAGETPFGMARESFSAAIAWLQRHLGSLALAIIALVVLCRALLFPLTYGADVQQLRSKRLASELAALRGRLGADPVRQQRAEAQLRRRHDLHPLRSFGISMLQLMVFLLLFSAVAAVAEGSTERLGWTTLGLPDPLYVLPALVTVLAAALVLVGVPRGTARFSRGRVIGASVVALLIGALVYGLSSAVNLYLVVSLAWVHAQAAFARRREARGASPGRATQRSALERRDHAGAEFVVPLDRALICEGIGGKAQSLARLTAAGFPVPPGFVLPDAAFEGDELAPTLQSDVLRAFDRLGARRVAVRSSGLDEDGSQHSYAGVFDTILHVERTGLLDALARVRRSMASERARAYSARARALSAAPGAARDVSTAHGPVRGAVVVQVMVPATHAGVLFTEHPGHTGRSLVELVAGLGEALVSGQASPEAFEFGRLSGALLEGGAAPLDLGPLLALGRAVEAHYGKPQDIEWAFAGEFVLLQSRDITADVTRRDDAEAAFELERRRVVAHLAAAGPWTDGVDRNAPRLVQNELVELLPEPTPYSAALMIELWQPGAAVDLACRALGMPYTPTEEGTSLLVHAFGQLMVDTEEDRRRRAQKPGALFGWRLARRAAELERAVESELAAAGREAERLTRALDLARLGTDELVHLHDEVRARFSTETYTLAEQVNIAAEAFVKTAAERLGRKGIDVSSLLGEDLTTVVGFAHERLRKGDVAGFVARFGHRAPHDFELSEPRYSESRELVAKLAALGAALNGRGHRMNGAAAPTHRGQVKEAAQRPKLGRLDRLVLERARRFQALKEEAKHAALHELALLRRVALELGRRIGLDSVSTFGLTPSELSAACRAGDSAAGVRALQRLEAQHEWSGRALPSEWSIDALERRARETLVPSTETEGGLVGIRVAGSGEIVGPVRVLRTADDASDLLPGEVLVARFTDPRWTPVFPRAAGVITEVGGWLSHAAILAREMGLPAIVGAPGATRFLRTGDVVRLSTSGRVDVLARRELVGVAGAVSALADEAVRAVAQ